MQFCTFPCFYTEGVSFQCVPVSLAGSDSEIIPCSHPASFYVGSSLLAFSFTIVFLEFKVKGRGDKGKAVSTLSVAAESSL